MNHKKRNVLIVGLGNPLVGDDGVGNFVIEQLQTRELPPNIRVTDCGTDILKITSHLKNTSRIILIDAVDAGKKAGEIFYFHEKELLTFPGESRGAHLLSVSESLKLLKKVNPEVEKAQILLIGIQPEKVVVGRGLTPPVKKAAREVVENIISQYGGSNE